MKKTALVRLTTDERAQLQHLLQVGQAPTRQLTHARILLKADEGADGPAWPDKRIAEALDVAPIAVGRVRQRYAAEGVASALAHRPPSATKPRRLDGAQEAQLVALALLRDGAAGIKANALKPWRKERWCIPPERSAEFAWRMEDVLDVYTRPLHPQRPLVCLDEASTQLLADVAPPLPLAPGRPAREDYEYKRYGTASLFLGYAPLLGQRHVTASERRTKVDFAHVIKDLLEVRYPAAEKVVLVMDNLNTHTPASLYEAFPPAEAKRLADRLEIHYTPKHGSWLNMAEIELSVLARQCLGQRLPDLADLRREVRAWETARNAVGQGVDWRFTTADARIKLKRLYPVDGTL